MTDNENEKPSHKSRWVRGAVAVALAVLVAGAVYLVWPSRGGHKVVAHFVNAVGLYPGDEVRVARITAVVIGTVAVAGGIAAKQIDVAFLVGLAFAIAASANLPSLLYSLFWPRFTARGALWSIYGGLVTAVGLIIFSPVISGHPGSSLISDPHINFAFFPLTNPAIVSIPLAFVLGWLGTVTDKNPPDPARYARMQVRALTGVGAERGGRS